MAKKTNETELNESQKKFCEEYIFDFNGKRSYLVAYPGVNEESAKAAASRLLTSVNVIDYLAELQEDLGKTAGISRLRVLQEYEKMAFSSIAHLHDTWITRKDFEDLTESQKACISEIATQTRTEVSDSGDSLKIDYVKIKLYDKTKALEAINKMLGYNLPDKIDLTSKGKSLSELSTTELIERANAVSKIAQNE